MDATKKNPDVLSVLVAAAMGLPGIAAHASDANVRNDNVSLSYDRAYYGESGNRMYADVHQASVTVPIADRYEVKLNAIRDLTSGASPFAYRLNALGQPTLLVTKATIRDRRDVIDVTGRYYGNEDGAGINLGHSAEDDYVANFISADYRRFFNDKTTTLSFGAAYSQDLVSSVLKVGEHNRHKLDLMAGVTQILDKNSVLQFNFTVSQAAGWLSDPYKNIMIGSTLTPDSRPGSHRQLIGLLRYSHYFEATKSALHLDYRYAKDDWGADSQTVEAKWRVSLGSGWFIAPGLRYYTQHNADFYNLTLAAAPASGVYSSDYRLASYGAVSPKLELTKSFQNGIALHAGYERYSRKYSYATGGGIGNDIDNFRYHLLSLSVEGAF